MGTIRLTDAQARALGLAPSAIPTPARDRRSEDWPGNLAAQARMAGLPDPVREHRFHPSRMWRFDLAWPDRMVACEVDGGGFSMRPCPGCGKLLPMGGRHSTGKGIRDDAEKQSTAAAMGWRVLRVVPDQIKAGGALDWLERALSWTS